jgi:hypothetical protein
MFMILFAVNLIQVAYLEQVLADDLRFRRASGIIVNKKEYLEDLQNRENTYEYLVSEDVKPIVYEGVALLALRVRANGTLGITFPGYLSQYSVILKN